MEQKEILEGNGLISDFMKIGDSRPGWWSKPLEELRFHESWDWIMPVIKKIAIIVSDKLADNYSDAKARWKPIANELQNCNLENVWCCVVQFIRWHNE